MHRNSPFHIVILDIEWINSTPSTTDPIFLHMNYLRYDITTSILASFPSLIVNPLSSSVKPIDILALDTIEVSSVPSPKIITSSSLCSKSISIALSRGQMIEFASTHTTIPFSIISSLPNTISGV
jgi:hypothetical protein